MSHFYFQNVRKIPYTTLQCALCGTDGNLGTPPPALPCHTQEYALFHVRPLDTTRVNRDVQHIVEEIISQLTVENGVTLTLRLEVKAFAPNGVQQQTVRAVSENCRTLKIKTFGFEEGEA